jgi:hypothetical protein
MRLIHLRYNNSGRNGLFQVITLQEHIIYIKQHINRNVYKASNVSYLSIYDIFALFSTTFSSTFCSILVSLCSGLLQQYAVSLGSDANEDAVSNMMIFSLHRTCSYFP